MSFLIQDAYAQGAAAAAAPNYSSIFLLVGFIVIFYFLFIRPQNKRAKDHRNLITQLQANDEITTNGGIMGVVSKVENDVITLAIAKGVEIKLQKHAVAAALPKGTVQLAE